ncbi:MAG TPA: class I mannose-6-phosphate isomerase, partial [Candidatus Angelobacter sp.]|nr:class I mannose-6-phosphate isomerase [Candidatus Angelobacter sp.]
ELCNEFGAQLLGESISTSSRFPLLIKFLFPHDKLSVQVHPDDVEAARKGEPCGKTECWYILYAEPGATVGVGLKPGTTKTHVENAIREIRMEQLLNWIDVRQGDMIYVDAGTVHAIGPGVVIVETQQNSDTTYRLYDYGRPRELHIQAGLEAIKEWTHTGKVLSTEPQFGPGKVQVNLISSPCFIVDKFKLSKTWEFRRPKHAPRSVWCLVAVAGCGIVKAEGGGPVTFSCGEAVIVPASLEKFILTPQWELEFLCASVPTGEVAHPHTVLPEAAAGR